ncbi:uncharacterized protein LOC111089016, partial [Limulus polyphemus]|uniref:Uncharacterized protein LOC111089016 n=1 Tax=Limulus polyphemus TaxID=6850 RepID=A0ABM1TKA2_LIMPO
ADVKHHCSSVSGCSFIEGDVKCDPETHSCICGEGTIEVATIEKTVCAKITSVGLPCDHHEQCIAFDTNSNCVEKTGSLDRVCHCRHGYKSEQSTIGQPKHCVEDPVEQTDPMSLRFGEGSILPIVLSVLAAVLVLFALACGIFHLFKWRKKRDQILSNPEADDSKEMTALNTNGGVMQGWSSDNPNDKGEAEATGFEPVYMMGL